MYNGLDRVIAKLRVHLLRMYGVKIQSGRVCASARISRFGGGGITIGRKCEIHHGVILATYGGDISIGDNVSINPYSVIYGHGGLIIGNWVRIAAHCVIIPASHKFSDPSTPIALQGETRIGICIEDDVWIGTGAKILDGVRIGKGAVIGAGAVVTKDVPASSVAIGVPAKVVGVRGTFAGK